MWRASMASSRGVTRIFGSGKPSTLVKFDLVRPISRARSFIIRTNSVSLPAMPSASAMQPSLAGLDHRRPCSRSSTFTRLCSAAYMVEPRDGAPPLRQALTLMMYSSSRLMLPSWSWSNTTFDGHQLGEARRRDQIVGAASRTAPSRFRPRSGWRAAPGSAAARPSAAAIEASNSPAAARRCQTPHEAPRAHSASIVASEARIGQTMLSKPSVA